MSQTDYSFNNFGTGNTSTGTVVLKSGPTFLHSVTINSTGTGSITFYNATTSSTGAEVAVFAAGPVQTFYYDAILNAGLVRGQTSSTADLTVTWA